ncbi:hypothetical protein ACKWTF_001815 [Chironomus riparius]
METLRATTLNDKVKIQANIDDFKPSTVVDFFNETVENFPSHLALASRDANGKWNFLTYQEYKNRVEKIAKVFIKLGLSERGVVAILAWNCPEWVVAALGAIHAGGVVTAIYTTSSTPACQYIIDSSKTEILIIDNLEQLRKINEIKDDLPHLKHIILLSDININLMENAILNWNQLMKLDTDDTEIEYQRRLKQIVPNECCTIMYTSGTTGFPKGAMLSHDSLIWNIKKCFQAMKRIEVGKEVFISYLPLSHLTAFAADIFQVINMAGTVYFADIKSVLKCLHEIQPTMFVAVPRIYEKIQEKLSEKINEFNLIIRKIFSWSQNVISEHYFTPNSSSLKCDFVNHFVIRRIKEALGFQNCKLFFTGSAPMSIETKKFFISLSMPIYEAYGMSESSTVHCLTSHETQIHSFESVGVCLDGTETKIINMDGNGNGEICMRGRHVFMGYLNDIQQTIQTIDDEGWLHTGDIGRIDENGLIFVNGRKKELIITSGGENIPKARIENLVKLECPAISNAFLIGDKRKFLSILLSLKTEIDENLKPKDDLAPEAQKWLTQNSLNFSTLSDILSSKDEKIFKAFQNVIDRVNAQALSNPQRIQKFAILPNDFTIVTGELTPTLKVKRHFVLEKYRNIIDGFYL